MLGRREDAEDVVQDVFLAVVRSREGLDGVRDLTGYLFAALHRAAGRCAQRRARAPLTSQPAAIEAVAPVEPAPADCPYCRRVQQAIRALPDEQREVLALKIDGELTFAQIAHIANASINTVASRYRYALQKLRTSLGASRTFSEGAVPKMGRSPYPDSEEKRTWKTSNCLPGSNGWSGLC